jgi:hypothetical protein
MNFKPLGDRALLKQLEREETTASGIVLPDTAKEKPQTAEVVAVGDGEEVKVKKGDGNRDIPRRDGLHDPRRRRHPRHRRGLIIWKPFYGSEAPDAPNRPALRN